MRLSVKRVVKAATPYGVLVGYRRLKPIIRRKMLAYSEQKVLDKKIGGMLANAGRLSKEPNPKIVVSLTSYGYRLNKTAPVAVASLFRQNVMPDRIILWLAYGEKPPRSLRKMKKLGLDIEYCEDLKAYKKLIPTLRKFPDSIIITVDDDIIYPKDWLKKTLNAHKKNPNTILAHRARKITVTDNKNPISYWDWPLLNKNIKNSHLIFPNGVAGVLYPAQAFSNEILNKNLFLTLAPHNDDIWFWAMSELKGTKRALINNGYSNITDFSLDDVGLFNTVNNDESVGNDAQIPRVLEHFPQLRKNIGLRAAKEVMTGLRLKPGIVKAEEKILHLKHEFAYEYAKKQAKKNKTAKILDFGCGDGYGADLLAKELPKAEVHGTDIDIDALSEARKKYARKNLHFIDMNKLEVYDLIVSFQVIEHVENVEEYLIKLKGLLKKGGKAIFTTPDRRYRLNDDQKPWNPYHLREYTKDELESDIKHVFPNTKIFQLTGEKNMLQIEYSRVAQNRADKTIYGGKEPRQPNKNYKLSDFRLAQKDTDDSIDLIAIVKKDF